MELKITVQRQLDPITYVLIERILDGISLGFRFYPKSEFVRMVQEGRYQIYKRWPNIRDAMMEAHADPQFSFFEISGEKVRNPQCLNFI